jgi:UDP-N-acetylglucosamine transferase subunit ALG13
MIFITVGTEKFPFDRLIKTMDEFVGNNNVSNVAFAQIGNCTYIPKSIEYKKFISFGQMQDLISKADIIVSHAGTGSIRLALSYGKIPIIMPRNFDLGEHLDDHQHELANKLAELGGIIKVINSQELVDAVIRYRAIIGKMNPVSYPNAVEKITAYLNKICAV